MYRPQELPAWHKYYDPLHSVTADCVLEWPDAKNCGEFPIICPVHGIWSRWCVNPHEAICTCEKKNEISTHESVKEEKNNNDTPIEEILRQIWDGELPKVLNGLNSGAAADSVENRRLAFKGSQLSSTPRGPVIVNSHSVRALSPSSFRKPNIMVDKLPLGFVYAYLVDLGLFKEYCAVLRSQIRHSLPKDLIVDQTYKEITLYRKNNSSGLIVNIFPNVKCFVTFIDYSQFLLRPDLHYGDQILELGHCVLQQSDTNLSRSASEQDAFRLRVRPCPFIKHLTLDIGACPIADETFNARYRQDVISYRDLGFSIHKGRVTSVAVNSPACKSGLKPDDHIVEVNGVFVVKHSDMEIIHLIRQSIKSSQIRSVDIVVIPERIHEHLKSVDNGHHVSTNRGFNLRSWINAEAFGFWYV